MPRARALDVLNCAWQRGIRYFDWLVCTTVASHAQVVDLARGLLGELFGADDLARIFETNACRFYGIA